MDIQIAKLTEATLILFLCAVRSARRDLDSCSIADDRVLSVASTFRVCGGTNGTGTGLPGSSSIFSCRIIPPILQAHSLVHYRC